MDDQQVHDHISKLIVEEQELRAGTSTGHGLDEKAKARMAQLEVKLDQYWDLLRRRQAREEFGQNPDAEATRDQAIVEHYQQ
ncbi:MAG TPA: DUF2630 family protein [Acidimicrobiales bacterium]|jgi:hypothetical protein|nr:DUF2630 family protein [Acidimicrobiales bacterium]